MKVLIGCEYSGIVRDAFLAKGHNATSCDLLPTESPGPHYQGDIFDIIDETFDLMIAFPPCTYLTNAGIGWFNIERYGEKAIKRRENRETALGFFIKLYNSPIKKVALENPVGYANTKFRKPDQVIQPYFFGDNHKKGTCLWLKGLPKLYHTKIDNLFYQKTHIPEPQPLSIQYRKPSKYYKGGEEKKRYFTDAYTRNAHIRSKTFPGIAQAMADQWG